jgi:hypothetical protein
MRDFPPLSITTGGKRNGPEISLRADFQFDDLCVALNR